jgi:hypothetical protein
LKPNPLNAGLKLLPLIYTVTIVINVGGILEAGPAILKLDLIPWWGKLIIGIFIAVAVYLSILFILVPRMRISITSKKKTKKHLAIFKN